MATVVVDSDVVSLIFKKDTRARLYQPHLVGRTLLISFMTLAELHAWAFQHRWGQTRRDRMTRHLGRYTVHHSDEFLCEVWADVDDQARRHGRPIDCGDAWIAATALTLRVPLVTHNPSDYAGVRALTIITEAP
jgi:predicted nucleic acid-binding protein